VDLYSITEEWKGLGK